MLLLVPARERSGLPGFPDKRSDAALLLARLFLFTPGRLAGHRSWYGEPLELPIAGITQQIVAKQQFEKKRGLHIAPSNSVT